MVRVFIALLVALFWGKIAYAQLEFLAEDETKEQEQENVLDSYIQDLEDASAAQAEARRILYERPKILQTVEEKENIAKEHEAKIERLREKYGFGVKEKAEDKNNVAAVIVEDNSVGKEEIKPENQVKQEEQKVEEVRQTEETEPVVSDKNVSTETLDSAPFGLYWGIDNENLQKMGMVLEQVQDEEYENVYIIKNTVQKKQTFPFVLGRFGKDNKLWNIYAESSKMEDDAKATKVLELYHKYYEALARKYGNAKKIFKPYIEEKTQKDAKGNEEIVQKTNPQGGDNFLEELQNEKAVLYATFSDKKIAVNLGVNVDNEGHSYIAIDYKNLLLIQQKKQQVFEQILDDL